MRRKHRRCQREIQKKCYCWILWSHIFFSIRFSFFFLSLTPTFSYPRPLSLFFYSFLPLSLHLPLCSADRQHTQTLHQIITDFLHARNSLFFSLTEKMKSLVINELRDSSTIFFSNFRKRFPDSFTDKMEKPFSCTWCWLSLWLLYIRLFIGLDIVWPCPSPW